MVLGGPFLSAFTQMELEDTMYSPPLSGTKGSLTGVEWPGALTLKVH